MIYRPALALALLAAFPARAVTPKDLALYRAILSTERNAAEAYAADLQATGRPALTRALDPARAELDAATKAGAGGNAECFTAAMYLSSVLEGLRSGDPAVAAAMFQPYRFRLDYCAEAVDQRKEPSTLGPVLDQAAARL